MTGKEDSDNVVIVFVIPVKPIEKFLNVEVVEPVIVKVLVANVAVVFVVGNASPPVNVVEVKLPVEGL